MNSIQNHLVVFTGFCTIPFALNILFQETLLFLNGSVNPFAGLVAFMLGLGLSLYLAGGLGSSKEALYLVVTFLVVFSITICAAFYFFDTSRDGIAYHQEAIIQIKEGWNYMYSDLSNEVLYSFFINSYPKTSWLNAATFYAITDKLESGKSLNLIYTFGTIAFSFSFLRKLGLMINSALLSSLLISLNSVVVVQLLSNYVDHINANMMAIMILCLIYLSVFDHKDKLITIILISAVILIDNKLTSIVYTFLFMFFFVVGVTIFKKEILRRSVLLSFAIGVVYLASSYNPYIKHIIQGKHPLHPAMGAEKINVIAGQVPDNYVDKNRIYTFTNSLFSVTTNGTDKSELKFPWIISWKELSLYPTATDTRKGGFGGTFALTISISVFLFIIALTKENKEKWYVVAFVAMALLMSVVISPVNWWARMVPQLWYVPVVLLIGVQMLLKETNVIHTLTKIAIFCAVLIQSFYLLSYIYYENTKSKQIRSQLEMFSEYRGTVEVDFGVTRAIRKRWEEQDISFNEVQMEDASGEGQKIVHATGTFILK